MVTRVEPAERALRPFVVEPPQPGVRDVGERLRELVQARELFAFLAWRDLAVRYKQTAIGILWAVLQAVLMAAVFAAFIGRLGGTSTGGVSYALFVLVALLPWQVVAYAVNAAAQSVVQNQELLKRVYFPRLLIPLAPLSVALADFCGAAVIALVWLALSSAGLRWTLLWAPAFLVLALVTAAGAGCWLAALNARFRDVQVAVPVLIQLWLFCTPVVYPSSIVPEGLRPLYALNPLVTVVDGFRRAAFGAPELDPLAVGVSVAAAAALALSGVLFYWAREDTFADVV